MIILGIDPGAGGAVSSYDTISNEFVSIEKCPPSAQEMSKLVLSILNSSWIDNDGKCIAYIEKVWARPSNATRAAFHFGENYGRWQGVLESHNIPIEYVLPTRWIKNWEEELDIKLSKEYREKKKELKKSMLI